MLTIRATKKEDEKFLQMFLERYFDNEKYNSSDPDISQSALSYIELVSDFEDEIEEINEQYMQYPILDDIKIEDDKIEIDFLTRNCSAYPFYAKLSSIFYELEFELTYQNGMIGYAKAKGSGFVEFGRNMSQIDEFCIQDGKSFEDYAYCPDGSEKTIEKASKIFKYYENKYNLTDLLTGNLDYSITDKLSFFKSNGITKDPIIHIIEFPFHLRLKNYAKPGIEVLKLAIFQDIISRDNFEEILDRTIEEIEEVN